ncbi:MAG TPA: carboxypeptidase-like regulatory domain-containing protein [Candidatus Acidoferrales bacterium]|nr:carboxypeptidase-like regulatory domain-containing protein [Candidatus Acidoferrales bacterium]
MNLGARLAKVIGVASLLLLVAGVTLAQDAKREAQLRTVTGVVTDKSESPLAGSVVFLQNMRTKVVRSSYTDQDGNYRFSGLDPNVDYEVHAEKDGAKSATRTVSSFDTRKEIVLNLKIDKRKS